MKWRRRAAVRYGLDPEPPKESRAFAALPVLADLGRRVE